METKELGIRSLLAIQLKERLTDPLIKRENELIKKADEIAQKMKESEPEEACDLFIDLATVTVELTSIQKARTEIAKSALSLIRCSDVNEFVDKIELNLNLCIARNKFESDLMKDFNIMSEGE